MSKFGMRNLVVFSEHTKDQCTPLPIQTMEQVMYCKGVIGDSSTSRCRCRWLCLLICITHVYDLVYILTVMSVLKLPIHSWGQLVVFLLWQEPVHGTKCFGLTKGACTGSMLPWWTCKTQKILKRAGLTNLGTFFNMNKQQRPSK